MQLWVVMVLLILLGLPHYLRRKKPRSAQCSNGTFNFTWTASAL